MIRICSCCHKELIRPNSTASMRAFCDFKCLAEYRSGQRGPASGHFKHGGKGTRLYRIWKSMRSRCSPLQAVKFHRYAGRGITVCGEWSRFETFRDWALSSGYSETLQIDRRDNDGNYCPENCRWVTVKQNCLNTSRTRRGPEFDAFVLGAIEAGWKHDDIARDLGVHRSTISAVTRDHRAIAA